MLILHLTDFSCRTSNLSWVTLLYSPPSLSLKMLCINDMDNKVILKSIKTDHVGSYLMYYRNLYLQQIQATRTIPTRTITTIEFSYSLCHNYVQGNLRRLIRKGLEWIEVNQKKLWVYVYVDGMSKHCAASQELTSGLAIIKFD